MESLKATDDFVWATYVYVGLTWKDVGKAYFVRVCLTLSAHLGMMITSATPFTGLRPNTILPTLAF